MPLGHVNGDPTQLHQVLLNLALNARDAMPEGGTLSLDACVDTVEEPPSNIIGENLSPGDYVVVEFRDTGSGMDQEVLLKIFEPFFSTKSESKGTGLGLASSLAILKSHGGGFTVQSLVGKGTTFKFYLPKSPKSEPETFIKEKPKDFPKGDSKLILIVDDEENIRNVGRGILEKMDYRVLLAENGLDALKLFEKNHRDISLVVTDMMMPVMTGAEAMKKFKKINPDIPILAMSGRKSYICDACGVPEYSDRFIAKPFNMNEFMKLISELIHRP
jgi:CheY-like chemotaxis protein